MMWWRRLRIKWSRYEYWPWWLFFLPMMPVYLWYAIRLRSPVYFTVANPGIEYGGFFGERKNEIQEHIPEQYLAKSAFITPDRKGELSGIIEKGGWEFPVVVKPDVGERGDEVVILHTQEELINHVERLDYPFILQEYVDFPIELGVLYCRLPNSENGMVTSITKKNFLNVVGDGRSTIQSLLKQSARGFLQIDRLKDLRPELMASIPGNGEQVVVERIGNHCLGTEFVNWNHLINERVHDVFDQISKPFDGFYYGRYDLKIRSVEEMYAGKGIKVFELNGVTSEPGHIYDSQMSLLGAYKSIAAHQHLVYQICKEHLKNGLKPAPLKEIIGRAWQHFYKGKR